MGPASAELGRALATGRTAEIYAWGEGRVLKLFYPPWGEEVARREAETTAVVNAAGLPAPAVHGLAAVDGRWGIVYERVSHPSLLAVSLRRPWRLPWAARQLAELHVRLHAHRVPGLPRLHERLADRIQSVDAHRVPAEVCRAVLEALEKLPSDDRLCHGDLHPENVVLGPNGPIILDWLDASSGPPLADVARTSLLLAHAALLKAMPGRRFIQAIRHLLQREYLRVYFHHSRQALEALAPWVPVVAAARLAEDIPEERPGLMALIRHLPPSGAARSR